MARELSGQRAKVWPWPWPRGEWCAPQVLKQVWAPFADDGPGGCSTIAIQAVVAAAGTVIPRGKFLPSHLNQLSILKPVEVSVRGWAVEVCSLLDRVAVQVLVAQVCVKQHGEQVDELRSHAFYTGHRYYCTYRYIRTQPCRWDDRPPL
jgi:hypothetical protein